MKQRGSASVSTSTLVGTQAIPVTVEVDIGPGLPAFYIVGLGDAAVLEARERVRSAIRASGFEFPTSRVIVNLAPAPLRKHGTGFDLPIAAAILSATNQIPHTATDRAHFVAELSLSGEVRSVTGTIAHALAAHAAKRTFITTPETAARATAVPDISLHTLAHLKDIGISQQQETVAPPAHKEQREACCELADVVGQNAGKRALEIAATGGHDILFVGPPGSGKTMLARCLPPLLPPLSPTERLEAALIQSVAGLDESSVLAGIRPFRAPHHSCSITGLVGGGVPIRPGEISLAHTGVLFLDEIPEFGPAALQALRQPIEDGAVTLVRAEGTIRFPAAFSLVAAANPCPCGFNGDPEKSCSCPQSAINRYRTRIGGPLMERIDIYLRVDRVDPALLISNEAGESTAVVRDRVLAARKRAQVAGREPSSKLSGSALLGACALDARASGFLERTARMHHLSGRGVTRLLRIARTIADLESLLAVNEDVLAEASAFRIEMAS